MKVKSENEVSQSCPTLYDPMDCSLPGSSIHGIFPARVLKWGAKSANDLIEISLDRLDQQVSQSLPEDSANGGDFMNMVGHAINTQQPSRGQRT